MSWIPYTGAGALARIAARATVIRVVLGVALIALVLAAAAAARHPKLDKQPLLTSKGGGMIVLDLSASISTDTYSRIGRALDELAARGGRYGLVIFSSQAYLALPPGTPASALKPFARYFKLPKQTVEGAQATFPVNPWTNTFTFGTQISKGLELARVVLLDSGVRDPAVVLISDLADDQSDLQRVPTVLESYKRNGISGPEVIALNPSQADEAYFRRLIGKGAKVGHAALPGENPSATEPPHASFPTTIVVLAILVAWLLAVNELRSARLRWGRPQGAPA